MNVARITKKRIDILKLIGKVYSNEAIAKEMSISISNVKLQISKAITYFRTGTRHRDVICALKENRIRLEDL